MADSDRCLVCDQTEQWHKEHKPIHRFQSIDDAGGPLVAPTPEPPSVPTGRLLRGDPVLRALLISKGVITLEDLTRVETTFREAIADGEAVVVTPSGELKRLALLSGEELFDALAEVQK